MDVNSEFVEIRSELVALRRDLKKLGGLVHFVLWANTLAWTIFNGAMFTVLARYLGWI